MQTESTKTDMRLSQPARVRYRAPIWTLLILAPVIGEVLSGSTRLSILFVLIPEMMVWGGGALLCREMVRRWRAGGISLLLLGLALSVAEEFVIQQTSLAPLPFPGVNAAFGRYLGVNWIYFLFMLGYESVWVVLVPVQVTELLFPAGREQPWLRKRGLIATCIVFLIGCRIAWYGWTQQALKRMNVAPYHPPALTIASGLVAIAILICFAYLLRDHGHPGRAVNRSAANPWLIGIVAFVFSTCWWALMVLIFTPKPKVTAVTALLLGLIWAMVAFAIIWFGSSGQGWSDMHRWAASAAATLSCMLPGYLTLVGWSRPDLIFKICVNVAAVVALLLLARKVRRRVADARAHEAAQV